jgi:glycosyltransferase involved in cell wall biosynthesis
VLLVTDIAVVVTCHEPYLKWLPQALESINRQAPAVAECVVAFDGCQPPQLSDSRWRVIQGDWRHPSPARNAGIAATTLPWVIFWDADDVMAEGYIAAMQRTIDTASVDTGIIYPDLYRLDLASVGLLAHES